MVSSPPAARRLDDHSWLAARAHDGAIIDTRVLFQLGKRHEHATVEELRDV